MSKSPIVPGRPGIGGGAPIYPVYPGGLPSGPLLISVADATVLGESITLQFSLRLNAADTATVTDTPNAFPTPLFLTASQSITTAEATALLIITPGTVNRLELVTVTDAPTLYITTVQIAVAEALTLSESQSFTIISPLSMHAADTVELTDSIAMRTAAPDLPPGPVITTERGAILCFCAKAISATTIVGFPFAATIIPRCTLAEVDVDVEIVLANLSANCLGPTFNVPLPPITGVPGLVEIRIDETIAVDSAPALTPTVAAHACPCVPGDYIVGSSVSDGFTAADGPDFSGGWTGITYDPLFANGGILGPNNSYPCIGTIRILNNGLENHRPKNEVGISDDGSQYVNGFRGDIGPAPNWLVRAVWGGDAKTSNSSPNKWYLMAPISFNAGPPYDALMMSCFGFYAQHLSDSGHPEDGYYFGLVNITAGGNQANLGTRVHKTVAEWGAGHSYALKVVCNELACITIQGIVDDVVEIELTTPSISSKTTGYPGVGLANDYLPNVATVATGYTDNYAALASWTADILI